MGILATAVTATTVQRSTVLVDARSDALVRGLVVALYFGTGIYTWLRRPSSRLGLLLIGVGVLQAFQSLDASAASLPFTVGRVITEVLVVYSVYVFVCFPSDRPGSASDRRFLVLFSAASAAVWVLALALTQKLPAGGGFTDCGTRCPDNALRLVNTSAGSSRIIDLLLTGIMALGLIWTAAVLLRHARWTSRLRRHAVTPVLIGFLVLEASYVLYTLLNQAQSPEHRELLRATTAAGALAIPLAFVIGLTRGRAFAIASIGRIVARAGEEPVTPAAIEGSIRDALGDPTATLALVPADHTGYVDVTGAELVPPTGRHHRAVLPVVRDHRTLAALIYDPSMAEDLTLVRGLAATSIMLLENSRLLGELRASRARIAAAEGKERRRIERNLHDGAQQRLVALQIRLARALECVDQPEVAKDLERASRDAQAALDELRALAHGIYPDVLGLGVGAALKTAARQMPIPVSVHDRSTATCPREPATAVYFSALEALQNAIKHAGPDAHVIIKLEDAPGGIAFSVTDDGVGFEPQGQASGLGLMSMRDRVEAAGGSLTIVSAPGRGTSVRGAIPFVPD